MNGTSPRPLRCRLGMHRWKTVGAPDGQYVRTCRSCGRQDGPFARPPQETSRLDARDIPPGGS
jgi:hypothetical protein